MSSIVKFKAGGLLFEVEGSRSERALFEEIAHIQEVFDQECGKCKSTELRLVVRDAESKDGKKCKYYEMRCKNPQCNAKLAFGLHQEGNTLFPKRKNEEGYIGDNGWTIWDSNKKEAV